jgi:hypothetical protein
VQSALLKVGPTKEARESGCPTSRGADEFPRHGAFRPGLARHRGALAANLLHQGLVGPVHRWLSAIRQILMQRAACLRPHQTVHRTWVVAQLVQPALQGQYRGLIQPRGDPSRSLAAGLDADAGDELWGRIGVRCEVMLGLSTLKLPLTPPSSTIGSGILPVSPSIAGNGAAASIVTWPW